MSFDEREGDAEAVTLANVLHSELATRPARPDSRCRTPIGTRVVGTILGYYVILTPAGDNDARFEGVIAFPLDTNLHAVAHFEALDPPNNSFVVNGSSTRLVMEPGPGPALAGEHPPPGQPAAEDRRGPPVPAWTAS